MTVVGFPYVAKEVEPTKKLDEINWDTALGKPHGVVGDNGIREPETALQSCSKCGGKATEPHFCLAWNRETKLLCQDYETNDLARYKDKINPDHYKKGAVEVIQLTEKLGFCEGNIVKYVARYKDKGGKDDLLKARWYLDRLIARYESDMDHYHGC